MPFKSQIFKQLIFAAASLKLCSSAYAQREHLLMDANWKFHLGASAGAEERDFQDTSWQSVKLPHDFVVNGNFDKSASMAHGYLPFGVGWYRRKFNLPVSDKGRVLELQFDGVYRDSTVWLNGKKIGAHASGYTGFKFDISEAANYGGSNVLVVRTDCRQPEGWWYDGGGIYRHVWLNKLSKLHFDDDSIYIKTTVKDGDLGFHDSGTILLDFKPVTTGLMVGKFEMSQEILDPSGRQLVVMSSGGATPGDMTTPYHFQTIIGDLKLWSTDKPDLYTMRLQLRKDGKIQDSIEKKFGFRTVTWDVNNGMKLNGKHIILKGTCNHQDFAGIGVALPDRVHEYKLLKLKEMGSNAYRCSHHPTAPELLDACDRLGILVMDENRHLGDSPQILREVEEMVLRDRNHPSIIMWSMCNEEKLQGTPEGGNMFKNMKAVVEKYDKTRPITCAMNYGWGGGISLVEDMVGVNYNPNVYTSYHKSHPNIPMYGSETASTVSTRGIYENDKAKGYVSAYDVNFPSWAQTAETAWKAIIKNPFMAGCFVWTGFDYRGEPTPYEWPCINSHFGILDTCGFPKDNYWYYKSQWTNAPVLHLLPHWNWAGKEGKEIEVWAQSNCDRIELWLNGKSMGSRELPQYGHVSWKVKYAPGTLIARGYRNGEVIATDKVETTGAPDRIELIPDRKEVSADGEDVSIVEVRILDKNGRVVPTASNLVNFEVYGAGHIAGVGNGDPSSHERDKDNNRHAFNGKCLVVVQSEARSGEIRLRASGPGLKSTNVKLTSLKQSNSPKTVD